MHECNFMLVIWIEERLVGTTEKAVTPFYPTIYLGKCKSNYVSTIVQLMILLPRFLEEVSYRDFKASSNIKFARTYCIRIKIDSILSDTITLTYFTSIQRSVYYLLIFPNSFLRKSIGSLRLSIFLK